MQKAESLSFPTVAGSGDYLLPVGFFAPTSSCQKTSTRLSMHKHN
jgi:hypothetical protein